MTRTQTLAPFPLPETCAGDVWAARSCAEGLLHLSAAPSHVRGQARLVLTAACLHLQARVGPLPELSDLHQLLADMAGHDNQLRGAMALSPLQIVQYVAHEFLGDAEGSDPAISLALRAVESARAHK